MYNAKVVMLRELNNAMTTNLKELKSMVAKLEVYLTYKLEKNN